MADLYKCASPMCPGRSYRASEIAHPANCGLQERAQEAAIAQARAEGRREGIEALLKAIHDRWFGGAGLSREDVNQAACAILAEPTKGGGRG